MADDAGIGGERAFYMLKFCLRMAVLGQGIGKAKLFVFTQAIDVVGKDIKTLEAGIGLLKALGKGDGLVQIFPVVTVGDKGHSEA